MDFSDLDFFICVCDKGFLKACKLYSINDKTGIHTIKQLENYVGCELFSSSDFPAYTKLTDRGLDFSKHARDSLAALTLGLKNTSFFEKIEKTFIIRAEFIYAKSLLSPIVSKIDNSEQYKLFNLELVTHENIEDLYEEDMHILFHDKVRADPLLFDKKWAIKMNQGLYASLGYLSDIGNVPEIPNDLVKHSIIGFGDTFDKDTYSALNWHLLGLYDLPEIEPAFMINSRSVIISAIEFDFGIGPVICEHMKLGYPKLERILPTTQGPSVFVNFFVKKNLPDKFLMCASEIEQRLLKKADELNLEVVFSV